RSARRGNGIALDARARRSRRWIDRHPSGVRPRNDRDGNSAAGHAAERLKVGECMTGDLICVLLDCGHIWVRAGLRAVRSIGKDVEVSGEAKNGREAVAMAERFKPDVVVMDLDMPELDGTAATKEIVTKGLPSRVLILTMHTEEDYLVPLMEAGAAG